MCILFSLFLSCSLSLCVYRLLILLAENFQRIKICECFECLPSIGRGLNSRTSSSIFIQDSSSVWNLGIHLNAGLILQSVRSMEKILLKEDSKILLKFKSNQKTLALQCRVRIFVEHQKTGRSFFPRRVQIVPYNVLHSTKTLCNLKKLFTVESSVVLIFLFNLKNLNNPLSYCY